MKVLHDWTPTLDSHKLKQLTGKRIWLKMECYQPPGSFKIRGIGRLCQYYKAQGIKHFISSSGGNAGLAVAYAGKLLGISVDVFMPVTSKQLFIDAIQLEGAKTHVGGAAWDDANQLALERVKSTGGAYIPPFDHPLIWSGHSTMIDEIVSQAIRPDAVVVAVGGGGLASGVLEGMHRHGWNDIPLYTVETAGTDSFAQSVSKDELITLTEITSIATSLGAKKVCAEIFNWRKRHPITPLVVSDKSCVSTIEHFVNDHRVLLEPAGAAALSVIYDKNPALNQHESILVIVCGGVGVSLELLEQWKQQFNLKE